MRGKMKKVIGAGIVVTIVVVVLFMVITISNINKMYSEYKEQAKLIMKFEEKEDVTLIENYVETSSDLGKTVEEVNKEERVENIVENKEKDNKESSEIKKESVTEIVKENIPDPTFIKPVEGEISKEYSKEKLIYSETLEEWTTRTGIDIETDLTTVVKASAEGIIKSIKNDPRYGLTVIIEHNNGFETRYSNLLTAEFVVVEEKVSQGQTIGTVGNTASFEILDKPHLHFEILKNSEYLEPTSYLK